eukprot:768821-Hanusia_phi.AAC.2
MIPGWQWLLVVLVLTSTSMAETLQTFSCGSCTFTVSDVGVLDKAGDCESLILWTGSIGIRVVGAGAFRNLTSLKSLILGYNHIETIPDDSLTGLGSLTYLYLSDNRLSTLPSLKGLSELQRLDVSRNEISTIPDNALTGLGSLTYLTMRWKIGVIQETYLRYEAAGDQYTGRTACGQPLHSADFVRLPPSFNCPDEESRADVDKILKHLFPNAATGRLLFIAEQCVARFIETLKKHVSTDLPGIEATGIPPHVYILRELSEMKGGVVDAIVKGVVDKLLPDVCRPGNLNPAVSHVQLQSAVQVEMKRLQAQGQVVRGKFDLYIRRVEAILREMNITFNHADSGDSGDSVAAEDTLRTKGQIRGEPGCQGPVYQTSIMRLRESSLERALRPHWAMYRGNGVGNNRPGPCPQKKHTCCGILATQSRMSLGWLLTIISLSNNAYHSN